MSPSARRRAFVWDAARINLPDGGTSLAMSVYPPESAGDDALGTVHRISETRRGAVLEEVVSVSLSGGHQCRRDFPPAWNIRASCSTEFHDKGKQLFWITAHEIGHSWFPMIVGSNERRNAWMDEGFNTFIDIYESDEFRGRRVRSQARFGVLGRWRACRIRS